MKNFKFIAILLCLLVGFDSLAGVYGVDIEAKAIRNKDGHKEGDKILIKKLAISDTWDEGDLFTLYDSSDEIIKYSEKNFEYKYNDVQSLWHMKVVNEVIPNLVKKGFQYGLRKEMEDDALDFINKVKEYNCELNDPYLEDYIYSLVSKIAPSQMVDGRPFNLNILIQESPEINACTFPNGTIVINTGLLSIMHTEDELVAILAHEIAHFVLDHSVINVNKEISRKKRAEFWAALATGVTAVAEGIAAVKSDYYVPGAATLGMAVLSSEIANQVIDRLGMKFNHEQEEEADAMALKVLDILGYNKNALSTALSRIEEQYVLDRNSAIYVDSYTHPNLVERINKNGIPSKITNKRFEQIVSFATLNVGIMKFANRRFNQSLTLVSQNIENNVALADDYIIKARCLLSTKNTIESNDEVLSLINRAKIVDPNNINIYKTEIIANLRCDNKAQTITLLNEYLDRLSSFEDTDFIKEERIWTKHMLIKLKGMIGVAA